MVRAGAVAEIPPTDGAFPLVRPVNGPLLLKPENAAVTVLLTDGVKENPLKPLKVALLSVWKRNEDVEPGKKPANPTQNQFTSPAVFLRLAFLIARFFNTSSLAMEKVPA